MHAEPIIYLSYTQAQLDNMYEQRQWASNAQDIFASWTDRGVAARSSMPHWRNIPYGASADERLDVFPGRSGCAPVHIHVHGGRWLLFGKDDVSFMAPQFTEAGFVLVAPDFSKIGDATLPAMVDQIRRAIAWVHKHAPSFGGDPDAIHVSGHSSGAHLLACALYCAQVGNLPVSGPAVKSAVLVSGIYDMRPVVLSARASYVKLSRDEVRVLSPILAPAVQQPAPLMVAWGSGDNPEFRRQSQAFLAEMSRQGADARGLELAGRNHFEAADDFGDGSSELSRAAVAIAKQRRDQLVNMSSAMALIG